jgi:hypothetical protein
MFPLEIRHYIFSMQAYSVTIYQIYQSVYIPVYMYTIYSDPGHVVKLYRAVYRMPWRVHFVKSNWANNVKVSRSTLERPLTEPSVASSIHPDWPNGQMQL